MKITISELRSLIAEAIKECGDMWLEPETEPMMTTVNNTNSKLNRPKSDPYSQLSSLADEAALMPKSEQPVETNNVTLLLPLQEKKKKKKWMQSAVKKPGALSKALGVPEQENIPMHLLQTKKAELSKKAEGDKKLSANERKLLQRIQFAITAKKQAAKKKKSAKKLDESFLRKEIAKIIAETFNK